MSKSRGRKQKTKGRSNSKSRQITNKVAQEQTHKSLLERVRHKWWFRAAEWAVGVVIVILGIVASIAGIWGPIWPTDPEIHPHDVLNGSSFILPFTVQNKSIVFEIPDAEFTCGVDWVFYKDARGSKGVFSAIAFVNGNFSIAARQTINYQCDASQLVKVNQDGSLMLRNMPFPPQSLYAPLEVIKMCLWIQVDYKIAGLIPRKFTSDIFQWPAVANVQQWLEGPVHREDQITQDEYIPQRQTLPPDVVTCSSQAHKPVLVFNKDGSPKMAPLTPPR